MTWVIGRAGPFGYAVGLSDVRVTLSNGAELDCLQKIYKIGNQMALGFAGSVAIGMENVAQLSDALNLSGDGRIWDPRDIAERLPIGAKKIFNSFDKTEQQLGCQLILLGAHPTERDGDAPWAKCYVYRFYAPEFKPIRSHGAEIVSIGSGSSVNQYVETLKMLQDNYDMSRLEVGTFGGSGLGLMVYVSSILNKLSVSGISRHLHVCIVGRNAMTLGTNNIEAPDSPDLHFVMPPVAKSMEELWQIIEQQCGGLSVKGASC